MTPYLPAPLTLLSTVVDAHTLHISLRGDLDYATAGELLDAVGRILNEHPRLRDLRIDCDGLGVCDSTGLSALLMAHRRTAAEGARLHLDRRGPALDRLLDVTGTLEHLTGEAAAADASGGQPT